MAENFDVVVIGAGPAGYVAAIRAAQLETEGRDRGQAMDGRRVFERGLYSLQSLYCSRTRKWRIPCVERVPRILAFTFDNLKLDYSVAVKRSRSELRPSRDQGRRLLDEEEQHRRIHGIEATVQGEGHASP
jgi:hypothetical protein